jgi:hypothetical protein
MRQPSVDGSARTWCAIDAHGGGTVDWVGTQSGGSPDADDDADADAAPPQDASPIDPQPSPEPPEDDE